MCVTEVAEAGIRVQEENKVRLFLVSSWNLLNYPIDQTLECTGKTGEQGRKEVLKRNRDWGLPKNTNLFFRGKKNGFLFNNSSFPFYPKFKLIKYEISMWENYLILFVLSGNRQLK